MITDDDDDNDDDFKMYSKVITPCLPRRLVKASGLSALKTSCLAPGDSW